MSMADNNVPAPRRSPAPSSTSISPTAPVPRDLIGGSETDVAKRFLDYGLFSDYTVTCQGHTFKVHKYVLVTKGGDFFQRAVCNGFRESQQAALDFPDDEPSIIARLLSYMYTGSYPYRIESKHMSQLTNVEDPYNNGIEVTFHDQAMLHVQIFAAATKFGLGRLQEEARAAMLRMFNEPQLPCIGDIPDLAAVVKAAYETTPAHERALRDIFVFEALHERNDCPCGVPYGSHALFNILEVVPGLALDIATYQLRLWFCQKCNEPKQWVVRPCECRRWENVCDKPACVEGYRAAGQCWKCKSIGCLTPPMPHTGVPLT